MAVTRVFVPDFTAGPETRFDEAVLPPDRAASVYNFDGSTGALTDGYGLGGDAGYDNVAGMWVFRRNIGGAVVETPMYCAADGKIYAAGEAEPLPLTFTSPPLAVNYKLYGEDVILLCSPSDDMAVWNGADPPYTVAGSPRVTSMTLHYERLFVTTVDRNAVYFSDDLDPTNWSLDLSGGGFIELSDELGRVNRVVSFANYVYIFRDRGVSRLTAFADQTEFSVVNLFVSSGAIYPETIAVCGDRILFLSDGGLYAFDGLSAAPVLKNYAGAFEPGGAPCACYADGKYYLALRVKRGGETIGCEASAFVNNGLLAYDPARGTAALSRGLDVTGFSQQGGGLALSGSRAYPLVRRTALPKRWAVPFTDLGRPDVVKEIAAVSVEGTKGASIAVSTERGEKVFALSDGLNRFKVGLSGRKLGLSIVSNAPDTRIARPQVIVKS